MDNGNSGFIAYANSRVEKLRDEGRYDAANKLKMYLRRFIAYLGKNSIPWESALKKIADRYKQDGTPLLFPVVTAKSPREQWRQYDGLLHRINYSLKKLGERIGLDYPLNLTVARHSWESMTKSVSISDIL